MSKILASSRPCAFAFKSLLCGFESLSLSVKNAFTFAFSADHSRASAESTSAADTREPIAARAPFQRGQPKLPPVQNVNSAVSRLLPACHFSGQIA